MENKDYSRVEDVDLYIVGAGICSAVGGISQCIALMICAALCWFGIGFMRGLKNEK